MTADGRFQRYEFKFVMPRESLSLIREHIAPFTVRDPYALDREDFTYTVRSTYFDTDDLRFYFERQDGLKVRKKLRVRGYNSADGDCPVFLEIKRKYGTKVFKERVAVRRGNLDAALNGHDPDPEQHLLDPSLLARHTLGRFRYSVTAADLRPAVLIVYEREAFVGGADARQRVTFDMNLRSWMYPDLEDPYSEDDLRGFLDGRFVLELKFDVVMPAWMRWLTRWMGVAAEPYSKYCSGIDVWDSVDS